MIQTSIMKELSVYFACLCCQNFTAKHVISKSWRWRWSKTCIGFNFRKNCIFPLVISEIWEGARSRRIIKLWKRFRSLLQSISISNYCNSISNYFYLNWPFSHSALTFYRNKRLIPVMFSQLFQAYSSQQ